MSLKIRWYFNILISVCVSILFGVCISYHTQGKMLIGFLGDTFHSLVLVVLMGVTPALWIKVCNQKKLIDLYNLITIQKIDHIEKLSKNMNASKWKISKMISTLIKMGYLNGFELKEGILIKDGKVKTKIINNQCPNCGANIVDKDPTDNKVICQYCRTEFNV